MTVSCVLMMLCLAAPPVQAPRPAPQSALAPEKQAQLDFILAGLRHNREKLRSGIYRVSGRKMDGIIGDPEFPRYEGNVELFCAFDRDQDLFRFERTEPQLFSQPGEGPNKTRVELKYIRAPDYSVHLTKGWVEGVAEIIIRPPNHEPTSYLNSLDVRMLGIGGWAAMNESASLEEALRAITNWPNKYRAFEETEGLYRLVIRFVDSPKHKIEGIYWFDESQGYAPVRHELRTYNSNNEKWNIIESIQVNWGQHDGVWIPRTFTAISGFPAPNMRRREYRYVFEWESINEKLDASLFARNAFDESAPPGTPKVDRRLGESVLVERVNLPRQIEKNRAPIDQGIAPSPRRLWFLIINAMVLGIIAIGLLIWWLRRA